MDKPHQHLSVRDRVRLRSDVSPEFYNGFGRAGNEGWVRGRQVDKHGYGHVLIEWDKDHWSYNGATDGWTWEGHFDKIEGENMSDPREDALKAKMDEFLRGLMTELESKPESIETGSEHKDIEELWNNRVEAAAEIIKNSAAFLIISFDKDSDERSKETVSEPDVLYDSIREDLSYALSAQASFVAAELHSGLAETLMEKIKCTDPNCECHKEEQ